MRGVNIEQQCSVPLPLTILQDDLNSLDCTYVHLQALMFAACRIHHHNQQVSNDDNFFSVVF